MMAGDSVVLRLQNVIDSGSFDDFRRLCSDVGEFCGKNSELIYEIVQYFLGGVRSVDLGKTLDICGTGGDGGKSSTLNISTACAFVLAALGVKVAKHGGGAVSSQVGSNDVLSALSVGFGTGKFHETGLAFLRASDYYPVFRSLAPLRKALGHPTFFNVLGPLLNPSKPVYQMVGVCFENTQDYLEILEKLGRKAAAVVHAEDGSDEIMPHCKTKVSCYFSDGVGRQNYDINPKDFGIFYDDISGLHGRDSIYDAAQIEAVLSSGGSAIFRDTIALNAGFALFLVGKARSISDGINMANGAIANGSAIRILKEMRYAS